jgi:hypothetical protein
MEIILCKCMLRNSSQIKEFFPVYDGFNVQNKLEKLDTYRDL